MPTCFFAVCMPQILSLVLYPHISDEICLCTFPLLSPYLS